MYKRAIKTVGILKVLDMDFSIAIALQLIDNFFRKLFAVWEGV
jgi:hypothetical protein